MSLANLAYGITDRDLFNGKSLPVFLNDYEASRKPKRLSEADKELAQAVAEQRAWMEEARLGMLRRVSEREEALINEPYSPSRNARIDRLEQARMLLYPKKGENDD